MSCKINCLLLQYSPWTMFIPLSALREGSGKAAWLGFHHLCLGHTVLCCLAQIITEASWHVEHYGAVPSFFQTHFITFIKIHDSFPVLLHSHVWKSSYTAVTTLPTLTLCKQRGDLLSPIKIISLLIAYAQKSTAKIYEEVQYFTVSWAVTYREGNLYKHVHQQVYNFQTD